jgi:hypothetical protein
MCFCDPDESIIELAKGYVPDVNGRQRAVAWVKDDPFGIDCGDGWRRTLDLRRSEVGVWNLVIEEHGDVDLPSGGGDPTGFAAALDCDLGLSPATNLMPILRRDLLSGGHPVELITAWVSVPDLSVRADAQRYSYLRGGPDHHLIRYEATDGSFAADITVDRDGLVVDYPGIARRVGASALDQG